MLCLTCNLDTKDSSAAINCDSCSRSLHTKCSGLTSSELRVMELKGKRSLKFFCSECQEGFLQVPKLIKIVSELQQEITKLKSSITLSNSNEDILNEMAERQKRATNIIIFNLPESSVPDHDYNEVSNIFKDITKEPVEIIKTTRIGKKNKNGARSLKITLQNAQSALNIIRNRTKLKDKNIFINADLTPNQRMHFNNTRDELKRRLANGEKDLTIKYIQGVPKIIQKNLN